MAITHKYIYYKGSLLDKVGSLNTILTGANFTRAEKGMCLNFDGIDDKAVLGNLGNIKSLAFYLYLPTIAEDVEIFEGAANDKLILSSSGTLSYADFDNAFVDGVDTNTITVGWHTLVITSTTDVDCGAATLALNNATYGKLKIMAVEVFDHSLSQLEAERFHNRMITPKTYSQTKSNFYFPAPTDLSRESGLVAAYNMEPTGGQVLPDISGNGNNGVITGALSTKGVRGRALKFDGIDNDVKITSNASLNFGVNEDFTYNIWVNSRIATNYDLIMLKGDAVNNNRKEVFLMYYTGKWVWGLETIGESFDSHLITAGSAAIINGKLSMLTLVRSGTTAYSYRDGVLIDTETDVGFDITNTSALQISGRAGLGLGETLDGVVEEFRLYNRALSADEIKDQYNKIAKQVLFKEDFSDEGADGVVKVPRGWNPNGTGSYKIGELATGDSVLSHLRKGTKYLENDSNGTILTQQSRQAYGTWEADVYKGAEGNISTIFFLSNRLDVGGGTGAFRVTFENTEAISFFKDGAGLKFQTATSYIENNTWYRIKLTRTMAGVFTAYIKGGAFGNTYTLIDVSGGSGTNPVTDVSVTTSICCALSLYAGDRITNMVFKRGVLV